MDSIGVFLIKALLKAYHYCRAVQDCGTGDMMIVREAGNDEAFIVVSSTPHRRGCPSEWVDKWTKKAYGRGEALKT